MSRVPRSAPKKKARAAVSTVMARLEETYPDARCWLDHTNALELLISTILSAQCTDARVNQVTPGLFRRFPDVRALAEAPPGELEEEIRSTGFFNAKARSIRGACRQIVQRHGGEVPRSIDELVALPGVGRKTANVVLGNVWNEPDGMVVDTHVGRLSRRLGWSRHTDPEKVEAELNLLVPKDRWVFLGHALIEHGRRICSARKPNCQRCPLEDICPKLGVDHDYAAKPRSEGGSGAPFVERMGSGGKPREARFPPKNPSVKPRAEGGSGGKPREARFPPKNESAKPRTGKPRPR